jgi:transcriptional regulator with XRE-family HTH domain
VKAVLRTGKPEVLRNARDTLGAKLLRRRRELGHSQGAAAALIGVDPKSFMWWERDIRTPADRYYPALIQYLGYEPWPESARLGERLKAERRRRGLSIDRAAAVVGVDEGTFGRWERGEWKPQSQSMSTISAFLRK